MPSGGFRPGSGRPKGSKTGKVSAPLREIVILPKNSPTEAQKPAIAGQTPLDYLLCVMNDPEADESRRDRAASIAAAYIHPKAGEMGKKGERQEAADRAGKGKFAPAAPPRLVVDNKR